MSVDILKEKFEKTFYFVQVVQVSLNFKLFYSEFILILFICLESFPSST